jgi:hypothetical protein
VSYLISWGSRVSPYWLTLLSNDIVEVEFSLLLTMYASPYYKVYANVMHPIKPKQTENFFGGTTSALGGTTAVVPEWRNAGGTTVVGQDGSRESNLLRLIQIERKNSSETMFGSRCGNHSSAMHPTNSGTTRRYHRQHGSSSLVLE